jgi:hypothetical protein
MSDQGGENDAPRATAIESSLHKTRHEGILTRLTGEDGGVDGGDEAEGLLPRCCDGGGWLHVMPVHLFWK